MSTITISTGTMIRALLLILLAYVGFLLKDILILILVAIVIASFVEAGVHMLAEYKISRMLAVPIIFAVVLITFSAIFYAFVPIVFRELSSMITLLINYLPESTAIDNQSIEGATQFVSSISKNNSINDILLTVKDASSVMSQGATSIIGSTFGNMLNIILVIVMSFYLSIQEKGIDGFLRILTPAHKEKYVIGLWNRTQHKIGLWFKGQLMLALIIGAISFVVLVLLGVQYAFLIGLISGISELIPFGIIFAAIPAILFAVIDGGVLLGVKVLVFYIIIQQVENYVLAPVVAQRTVGIPPLVVLLAFMIGISLAGFWGAIVAMPVAVFVLEYMSDIERQKIIPFVTNK